MAFRNCRFVEKPPAKFIQSECPVCQQILCEPYQVTCCGNSFCRDCIERVQKADKPCPTCKKRIEEIFHNKRLQRSLYGLKVYCSHEQEGCQWKGELGQLKKHLNLSPLPGKQLEGCEYTEIECIYCSKLNKRFALENHVTRDCPNAVIDCDFHHVGCDVRLPRKDMPAHLKEKLVTHMSLQLSRQTRMITELQEKVDKQGPSVVDMKAEYNALAASHSELQASHSELQASHNELQESHEEVKRILLATLTTCTSHSTKLQASNDSLLVRISELLGKLKKSEFEKDIYKWIIVATIGCKTQSIITKPEQQHGQMQAQSSQEYNIGCIAMPGTGAEVVHLTFSGIGDHTSKLSHPSFWRNQMLTSSQCHEKKELPPCRLLHESCDTHWCVRMIPLEGVELTVKLTLPAENCKQC